MGHRRTIVRTMVASIVLLACIIGSHSPSRGRASTEEERVTKKIIVSRDLVIVNGDTINLDDLKESLHRVGEIDITIVGDIDDLQDVGITKKRSEIVRFGGDVRIEEDEKVTGAVVVFGGSATIAGVVNDDVVVLGGDLIIEETADIKGSAVCMGGDIIRMPGSRIGEQEIYLESIPFGVAVGPVLGYTHRIGHFWQPGFSILAGLVCIGLILLFGAGAIFFFPRPIDRISATIETSPVKSGFVGLLGEILLLPLLLVVSIILCISIIGIPFLFLVIPLAILGVIAAFFFGYVSAGVFIGRKIGGRANMSLDSTYRVMVIGIFAILAFDILSGVVGLTGDALWPVQALFGFIGGVVFFLALTVGFGAVIMSKFGTRSFPIARKVRPEKAPADPEE